MVDRLLASPRYGEAWGRMWLDVARYGEDDYRSASIRRAAACNPYPNAYLYRDWVIKAFNDDMPYDQFVRAQLAGDLLDDEAARARTLPALGFLGLGPWYYDNGAVEDHARRRAPRSRRRRLARLPRADGRLRALPRPQVRSDSDEGLLLARRRVPEHRRTTSIRWRRRASSTNTRQQDKKIEKKEKLLERVHAQRSRRSSAETLALQASKYMQAAWRVTGEPKDDMAEGRRRREARLRAVRSLAQVPREAADASIRT